MCFCLDADSDSDGDDGTGSGQNPRGDKDVGARHLHAQLSTAGSLSGQASGPYLRQGELRMTRTHDTVEEEVLVSLVFTMSLL